MSIKVGDWFRIIRRGSYFHDSRHRCTGRTQSMVVRGEPPLELGAMIHFESPDHRNDPGKHAYPEEWCTPCEAPSMAKRVVGLGD
jgi:hypothetical protein